MRSSTIQEIYDVVANTKLHKDAFAVPALMEVLRRELEHHADHDLTPQETILQFVDKAVQALATSPIYSATLIRELYRSVLDIAGQWAVPRRELLEDLLFQSVRRSADAERGKRRLHKDARSRILKAALDEFSDKGFHHSTIDTIAERAGIAKGTVYRYFKTKDELFNALKEDSMTEFLEEAKRAVGQETDVLKILDCVIRSYLGFFEKNSAFFKVIIQEQKDFGREFSEKFINELILAFPGLKRACWKASRQGKLKQMNYFTVFFGIVGFLNGVIQKWLHEGCAGSLLDEVETVKEVLFHGFAVSPEKTAESGPLKVIS